MKKALLNLAALALVAVAWTSQPAKADTDEPQATITGTVVSMHHDDFVLATDKGNLKFDMSKDTDRPANLAVGSRVTVSYDSDEKLTDEMKARHVVMVPEVSAVTPVTPAPEPVVQTPPPAQPEPVATSTETTEESHELPATASPLPLIAVLGLLALAGGLALRKPSRV